MKKDKNLNKKKTIIISIIAIAIILFAVVGTLYEKNITIRNALDKYLFLKEKHENNLPKIQINVDSGMSIYAYKNKILTLENNLLTIYNHSGNKEDSLDVQISNPIFKSNGEYLCIAEKNGKRVYMISGKNILWQKDLENDIVDVTVNENGYLALSLSGTIHKTIIQAFDNKGTPLFRQFLSSTYVTDMDISPDNKYLAIAEVNLAGILIQSNIKVISIEKVTSEDEDSLVYTNSNQNGDLIVKLKYENKDTLVCIFDNHIETIKDNTNSVISDFKEEDVLFADINNKIVKVIAQKSNTYLQIISPTSNSVKNYEIDEPKEVYVSEDIIALNLGSEVLFYNNSGWLLKKYYATQEIDRIVLCNNLAGVVYNNKIELISL